MRDFVFMLIGTCIIICLYHLVQNTAQINESLKSNNYSDSISLLALENSLIAERNALNAKNCAISALNQTEYDLMQYHKDQAKKTERKRKKRRGKGF